MTEYLVELENHKGYFISTKGNIYSQKTMGGRVDYNRPLRKLNPPIYKNGYRGVKLPKVSPISIHTLVAKTFIHNPENKPVVDHINQNKLDNRVENLRWATKAENAYNSKIRIDNKSGIKGVREVRTYWEARWRDANHKIQVKYFSKKKLGYEEAKRQAIIAREEATKNIYKI